MLEEYDKRKIAGCFTFGCLTCVVLFALGGVGAYFGVTKAISSFVNEYTEPFPRELPKVQLTAEESDSLFTRVETFREAAEKGEETIPLELTARDVNHLIATDPELAVLRDKVSVEFEDGKISSEVSIPLSETGLKDLQGRYLNGRAAVELGIVDGRFEISLSAINVNGNQVPDKMLQQLEGRVNLADRIASDPRFSRYTKFVDKFQIVGDRLVVEVRKDADLDALQKEIQSDRNLPR